MSSWEDVLAELDRLPDRATVNAAMFKVIVAALGEVITDLAGHVGDMTAALRTVTESQQALAAEWRSVADDLGLTAEDPEQIVRPA